MVRARNPRPSIVKCGNEQRCMFLEPREQDALVSWDVYLAWRRTQEAGLTDVDVRRQLREEKVKQVWIPETQKWLEVSTPVSMDMVVDGVHMKTRVAVVLQGQLKEGIVLSRQQLRCWSVRERPESMGTVDIDDNALVELKFPSSEGKDILLRGLIDTGAGLSLMTLEAWKTDLYAREVPYQESSNSSDGCQWTQHPHVWNRGECRIDAGRIYSEGKLHLD